MKEGTEFWIIKRKRGMWGKQQNKKREKRPKKGGKPEESCSHNFS